MIDPSTHMRREQPYLLPPSQLNKEIRIGIPVEGGVGHPYAYPDARIVDVAFTYLLDK